MPGPNACLPGFRAVRAVLDAELHRVLEHRHAPVRHRDQHLRRLHQRRPLQRLARTRIAFTMAVPAKSSSLVQQSARPAGAKWEDPPVYIDKLQYRFDGAGYLRDQFTHIFLLSADGGHPRQLTTGDYNHGGAFSWTPDGRSIIFSANRRDDAEYQPRNSEIYEVDVASGSINVLTDRIGPDRSPVVKL